MQIKILHSNALMCNECAELALLCFGLSANTATASHHNEQSKINPKTATENYSNEKKKIKSKQSNKKPYDELYLYRQKESHPKRRTSNGPTSDQN